MKKIKLCVLAILLTVITSCIKNKTYPQDLPVYFRTCFAFKKGSYWIYQDSGTQAFDTIRVANSGVSKTSSKEYPPVIYDKIFARLSSSYYGDKILFDFILIGVNETTSDVHLLESIDPDGLNQTYILTNNIDSGYVFGRSKGVFINKNFYKTFQLNSKSYTDVLQVECKYSTFGRLSHIIYWCPTIGKIKYSDYNGHVWELVKYKTTPI